MFSSESVYIYNSTRYTSAWWSVFCSVWTWHIPLALHQDYLRGFFPPFQAIHLQLPEYCPRTLGCASWMEIILTYSVATQEGLNHACHRSNWQGVWGSWVFYRVKTNNFSWIFQHWTMPDSFELSQGMTQTPLTFIQLLPSSFTALFIVNRLGNVIYSAAATADMLSAMP